jgi:hypothetical protein
MYVQKKECQGKKYQSKLKIKLLLLGLSSVIKTLIHTIEGPEDDNRS